MRDEPVVVQAALLGLFNLLAVFGLTHWTIEQAAAVNAVLVAVLGLVTRSFVSPVSKAVGSSTPPRSDLLPPGLVGPE